MKALRLYKFNFFNINKRLLSSYPKEKNDQNSEFVFENLASSIADHVYAKKYTKSELVNYLADNVVHHEDNVIVTNKPYGVGINKTNQLSLKFPPQTFNELYLEDVQEDLAKKLNVPFLEVVVFPNRLASGITIFASSNESKIKLTTAVIKGKNDPYKIYNVLTVVVGHLEHQNLETKFQKKLDIPKGKVKHKREKTSNANWNHNVISSSEFCSLLRVKSSHPNIKYFLASKCMTPVLGDSTYGGRCKNVLDVPVFAEKFYHHDPQFIPPEVLSALELKENCIPIIPAHIHFHSICLPFVRDKGKFYSKKFFVSVPPPEHFIWTCKKLNLIDEDVVLDKMKFTLL